MINSRSQKRIAEIVEYYHQYNHNAPLTKKKVKRKKSDVKKCDGRSNNHGYGYRRPVVVIRGEERFEFRSINSCAKSKLFKCSPKTIRRFAENRAFAGDCMVYYKNQLPEGLK